MKRQACAFPLEARGYIQQWLGAGLFADLLVPSAPPAEGDLTAGEPWTLYFTRFRRVRIPGYRRQEGTWWMAVCSLRSEVEQQADLEFLAPEGTKVCAADGRDWGEAREGLKGLRIGPRPLLIVLALPARTQPQMFAACVSAPDLGAVEVSLDLDTSIPLRVGRAAGRDVWIQHNGKACPTIWVELLNITAMPLTDISISLTAESEE
ncbi:MAG: hypothetical protein H5T86_15940, partial [Armatimonadetes bacterium]|nr:hypothetical protein [Armatimonadota bacterium]